MKTKRKRKCMIVITGIICILLLNCAKERARTDIALEMTDEDSVEAIIDQDLLTAGGTVVNLEEPEETTSASVVTYVDEGEMQEPVVVEAEESLKPADVDSEEELSVGLIDVDDIKIEDPDSTEKTDEKPAAPITEESMSTEELIAVNDALMSTETVTNVEIEENILPGETVKTDENIETGETAQTTSVDEITFPDETEKSDVRPAAVRPPGGGYYTEYKSLADTPAYPNHTVKRGDTLWSVSKEYGCSISELVAANNISRRSVLRIGQELAIPLGKNKNEKSEPVTEKTDISTVETSDEAPAVITAPLVEPVEKNAEVSQSETEMYTVKSGDSYWKIAKRYGISSTELMKLNNASSSLIRIGQKIKVPQK